MLIPSVATGPADFLKVLQLQAKNHKSVRTPEEQAAQGFLTVLHTPEQLEQLAQLAPQVVVRHTAGLAGYALSMPPQAAGVVPELGHLFDELDAVAWKGAPLRDFPYYVMGQVCVDEAFRGKGVFDLLYGHHRQLFSDRYALLVTEIDRRNSRSLAAHSRVGFREANSYTSDGTEWVVVVWDWRN